MRTIFSAFDWLPSQRIQNHSTNEQPTVYVYFVVRIFSHHSLSTSLPPSVLPSLPIFLFLFSHLYSLLVANSSTHAIMHTLTHTRIVTNNVFPLLELFFLFAFVHSFIWTFNAVKILQISITFSASIYFALMCVRVSIDNCNLYFTIRNNVYACVCVLIILCEKQQCNHW